MAQFEALKGTPGEVHNVNRLNLLLGDQQSAIADLTEDSGAIGGTNDGDLPDLSTPDAAGNAAAIREVAAKLNGLLAAVRAHGLIASG